MSALAAYRDGRRRVRRAPAVVAGVYVALLVATVPAALLVRQAVVRQLGTSGWASAVADRPSLDWFEEFGAQASGLGADLEPAIIGFAAVLRNLSDLVSSMAAGSLPGGSPDAWLLVALGLLGGTFLSGGILDRYARQRVLHAQGFFGACGALFFRLLRLNVLVWLIAAATLGAYGWMGRALYRWLTHDLASERMAFAWALVLTAIGAGLVLALTIVADCARVRTVVEDRRSMIFALTAGARFAGRHAASLLGLYALLVVTLGAVFLVYALVAPAPGGGWPWAGFLVAQIYIVARIAVKLLTYASVTAFFQSALAHATYVAVPTPVWPESPAIDTLGPPAQR